MASRHVGRAGHVRLFTFVMPDARARADLHTQLGHWALPVLLMSESARTRAFVYVLFSA